MLGYFYEFFWISFVNLRFLTSYFGPILKPTQMATLRASNLGGSKQRYCGPAVTTLNAGN